MKRHQFNQKMIHSLQAPGHLFSFPIRTLTLFDSATTITTTSTTLLIIRQQKQLHCDVGFNQSKVCCCAESAAQFVVSGRPRRRRRRRQ